MHKKPISVVIPVFNEAGNIEKLLDEINVALTEKFETFEVILVNDQSQDETESVLKRFLKESNSKHIKLITNEENLGQGVSIYRGIKAAAYSCIAIMDGDLQVDPRDIYTFYTHMQNNNLDFVCSRRSTREDNDRIFRHLPSIIGNALIRTLLGGVFTDVGSSLKIIPKENALFIKPFRHYHRYISIYLYHQKLTCAELEIIHRPRSYGQSNYSIFKFVKVLPELVTVYRGIKDMKSSIRLNGQS